MAQLATIATPIDSAYCFTQVKVVDSFTRAAAALISVKDADAARGYVLYRALVGCYNYNTSLANDKP